MLKSKIHRATVTDRDPDHVGSITLDPELMQSADVIANEQVHVWDIENGARFVTYAIEGEPDTGAVEVNGVAARLVSEDSHPEVLLDSRRASRSDFEVPGSPSREGGNR